MKIWDKLVQTWNQFFFFLITVASGIVRDIVSSPTASLSSISHERGINLIPQTGVSSGAAYLDTSNLLRPATPSRLPGSVDGMLYID